MIEAPVDLIGQIAGELGEGWTVLTNESPWYCTLVAPGGWVFLSVGIPYGDHERIEVSVNYHAARIESRTVSSATLPDPIRMSMRRGSAALAADIRRRILGAAEAFFAVAYLDFDEWRTRLAQANRDVALLVEVSRGGLRLPRHDDTTSMDRSMWANRQVLGCSGSFRLIGQSVEISLSSVPVSTATAILELLQSLHSEADSDQHSP